MKTIICLICAVITTSVLAAHPQVQYSGTTYEVEVVRDNGSVSKECITFHENGRYTMSGETLTMLWAPQVEIPDQFMAVTAPGERTVVPYHQGVYGAVLPDKSVKGHGINQDGSTFEFNGRSNDDCYTNRTAQAERNANSNLGDLIRFPDPCLMTDDSGTPCNPIPDPLRALVSDLGDLIRLSDDCLMATNSGAACDPIADPQRVSDSDLGNLIRFPDPCPTADDSWTACNPIPDPLRSDTNNVAPSTLAGHSFRLTLGTSDQNVVEYCWTFGEKDQIETANGGLLARSPTVDPSYKAGFRSVGAGSNGRGMAYHGKLVGDNLLEVVGIEARDGNSVVTYGFGQQVATCQ